jgi:hypothetical protein
MYELPVDRYVIISDFKKYPEEKWEIFTNPLPFCRTNRHRQANFVRHGVLRKEKQTFLKAYLVFP